MKKIVIAITLFLLTLLLFIMLSTHFSAQPAQSIQQIYVFGDSLSDTGNVFRATNRQYPPSPPYFQGRYSNGRVWVEYLAQNLSVQQIENFAFGGATTDRDRANLVPGLLSQVQSFVQTHRQTETGTLYVLWAGANDYLQGASNPTVPIANLTEAIAALSTIGADHILVGNLPDLGQLPATRSTPNSSALSRLTQEHNAGLQRSLQQLQQQSTLKLALLDAYGLYQEAIAHPSRFGFTNVTSHCLSDARSCSTADQFLFWDSIHPSTAGHKILGDRATAALQTLFPIPRMAG